MRNAVSQARSEARKVIRAASPPHSHLRDRLVAVGVITVIVDVVCSVLAYLLERHGTGTQIHNLGDAFFWTSTQLLTVSSQLRNPITTGGRLLDIFMEAYAITVVATLAGSFGAFFHQRSRQRVAAARRG